MRPTGHRFLFDTSRSASASCISTAATLPRYARGARGPCARTSPEPGARSSSRARCRHGSAAVGRDRRRRGERWARLGPVARASGLAIDASNLLAAAVVHAASCRLARRNRPETHRAPRDARRRSWTVTFDLRRELLLRPSPRPARRSGTRPQRPASGSSRARAVRPVCVSSPKSSRIARPAPAHRLLRELAGPGAGGSRTSCCPDSPLVNKSFELCYACVDR